MRIFDLKVQEALRDGLARQVVLADDDGFVLDNGGYVFDPDELVAVFMATQRQIQGSAFKFDFGPMNEFSFAIAGPAMTIACRRVFSENGGCMVIVVVPMGGAHNLIIADVIRAHAKYMESQLTSLWKV